jgi:hypothetical protein
MTPAFQHLVSSFNLLKLNITIQFQQDAVLPAFKGSMLHGWFGHALKAADERAFFVCYGEHDNQQPKPYVICPNEDHKTHWKKGELFTFELTLFGEATQLADKLFIALKMGESLGFGAQRTPFKVLSIASVTPNGLKVGIQEMTLADAIAIAPFNPYHEGEKELAITFTTPVRIKYRGNVCRTDIPDLDFLINQLLRRLVQLSRFWVIDDKELFDAVYSERPVIRHHQVTNHCYFEDWQRFSQKNREHLPFGGLKGQVSFWGDINHSILLLKVGELLHIGGKTTFGLGKYQLIT